MGGSPRFSRSRFFSLLDPPSRSLERDRREDLPPLRRLSRSRLRLRRDRLRSRDLDLDRERDLE